MRRYSDRRLRPRRSRDATEGAADGKRTRDDGWMTGLLRRWVRSNRRRFHGFALAMARRILLRHAPPPPALGLQKIGTAYGGWVVPAALVKPDWICYCGGVGED